MIHHLRALAVFAKTVEMGSFRSAARALQLSPSVVSHHISQLEEQLGVTLLYRSTRSLSLTRDGERLVESAQQMLTAAETGIQSVLNKDAEVSGELRVTAPAFLAQSLLADRVASFIIAHPNVKIEIDYTDSQRDIIDEGIDVAIRVGWLRDNLMKARKMHDVERVILVSPSYIKKRKPPRRPKDIESWDWLELTQVPLKPELKHPAYKPIILRPTSRVQVNSAVALYHLMLRGVGLAILPRSLAEEDVRAGHAEILFPEWNLPPITIYAVRPPNASNDSISAVFADWISKE